MPWPLFMALLRRAGRFQARGLLTVMDGASWAIGAAFSDETAISELRARVADTAYGNGKDGG